MHQLRLVPPRLPDRDDQVLLDEAPHPHRRPDGCIDCGICTPVCPVNVIYPVPDYVVPSAKLEAAKGKAKAFAANQRRMKQDREAAVARALANIGGR